MKELEKCLETGGTKKDIAFLVLSGIALIFSIFLPDVLSTPKSKIPKMPARK